MRPDARSTTQRRSRERARSLCLAAYGGRCACCGEDEYPFLVLDHINGGGIADRKALGGPDWWVKLVQAGFPPGYQVLCCNCNAAKERPGGCPHASSSRVRTLDVVLFDEGMAARQRRRHLTCPNGHVRGPDTTYREGSKVKCLPCRQDRSRRHRAKAST